MHSSLLGPFLSFEDEVLWIQPLVSPANIRQSWKGLAGTNTQTYLEY